MNIKWIICLAAVSSFFTLESAFGFEGHITIAMTRGGATQTLLYTMGTNDLRIECLETDRPYPRDIIDLASGQITLLFPHNRSFVRLPAATAEATPSTPPGFPPGGVPPMPSAPSAPMHIGPTNLPGMPNVPPPQMPPGVGPQAAPGAPGMAMPMMPMMPPMSMEQATLKAMNDTTNILGYSCAHFEIQERGEIMEIWATDKLLPFQPWLQNQQRRFRPRMPEEEWSDLLKSKKLFPMLAVLRFQNGGERLRFQVTQVEAKKIEDPDGSLFQPPPDYLEIQPLPF